MKRWKKVLIFLFCTLILVQIPFIYNRFHLAGLEEKIKVLNENRAGFSNPTHRDFKGSIHVHSSLGGHSTATFEELVMASLDNDLDFVVMTEHYSELIDTSAMTLKGFHGKTLFINGNEIDTASGDRFLQLPGSPDAKKTRFEHTDKVLEKLHAEKRLAFITYPEKFRSWDSNFDGIEIFSLHTNSKKMNPVTFLPNALWSFGSYPELLLYQYFIRPDENLRKYDEIAKKRKITLFSGTDAHSNIGYHFLGDDTGKKLISLKFDNYNMVLRLVKTHVLLKKDEPLTAETLLEALKNGHCFIGFDVLGDTSGFSFTAGDKIMGDEISFSEPLNLKAQAPQSARFVVFKDGEKVFEAKELTEINFEAKERGVYRVEVYLDQLGSPFNSMPWIISNPIYLR